RGLPVAGGRRRVVTGQVLHQAHVAESGCLREAVAGAAGQCQGLPVAGGRGRVVTGQHVKEAQLVEDVGLARQVVDVTIERKCPGPAGGGGRVVAGLPLQGAQFGERVGFAAPVSSLARRGQGGPVQGGGLVPVTAGGQEAAYRGGQGDGMRQTCVAGGVVRGGVQVRPLGFQPGGRLPEGG